MSLARDSLLRTLGEREGEKLSGAVHLDSIPAGELPLLGDFRQEGLVRVSPPSVQFAHDLMGDWARYRMLRFAGNSAAETIKALAHVPRWGRAIRLYAQSLAEHGKGLGEWQAVTGQFSGEDAESKLASDLFLDGLLFAANSELLLEQVWADLNADKGQILHRVLKRLIHVASFPDWRLRGGDAKLAEQSEAWFRIPQPLYWVPVLRVLSRHSADVAKHALIQGAEVCALWLRTMPVEMPGRREAGSLALKLAKEAQGLIAEGMLFGDKDKVIYEAMLSAAPEFPDEVTQIALELCGRKNEPAHAVQRRHEERERRTKLRKEWEEKNPESKRVTHSPIFGAGSYRDGPLRPPAVGGPLRAVSDGFQSAVMETPALSGLIAVRPKAATEILLAVCIEEPKRSGGGGDRLFARERLGLADWRHGYPAMYWKGPFLQLLQNAPEEGLDAIVRLVNYATSRWIEDGLGRKPSEEERKHHGFEFEFNGTAACWIGDCNVYGWHRYLQMHGDTVECALMALEKWLYDEIGKGKSISQAIQYIFDHAESVAFAGLLISVGLRYPGLFTREFQPLLGNFYVYECQASWAMNERNGIWAIAQAGQPEFAVKLASKWHRMAHRQYLLRDFVPLMLEDEGTLKYLSARKVEWAKLRQGTEKSRQNMEFFLARFDPANYTKTPQEDGRVLITMRWPRHLEEVVQDSQGEMNLRMLVLTLAPRARQLLEGQETLRVEDLPEFAAKLLQLAEWKDPSEDGSQEHYRVSSIAGGLAVLVIRHRRWLSENAALEKWCLATLRDLKPVESEHFSPHAIDNHGAEAFLGEAGVALLQESSEEWVLRMAFDGVTGAHYSSTLFTVWRAYVLRQQLGERFGELLNVVVLWSALRLAAIRESGYYADTAHLAKYRKTLFRRFVTDRLKGALIPLQRAETLGRHLVERIKRRSMSAVEREQRKEHREWIHKQADDRKVYREMAEIDLEVIQQGFGFVWGMIAQHLPGEEQVLQQYVQELFDLLMRTFPPLGKDDQRVEIDGTPYESDRWILGRVAEFVAHTNSVETARKFYRPILDLGPAGRYWVEDFLRSWASVGAQASPDLQGFALIWQDMVAYTDGLPTWQPAKANYWSRAEGLAVHLMGLSDTAAKVLGDAKYKPLVSSMAGTVEQWGNRWLKHGSAAGWYAYFLRTESGQVLLERGVKQLAGVVDSLADDDWHRHDLGAMLTEVLSLCWKHRQKEVENEGDMRQAFLHVLAVLCARQVPEALHLRSKVSELLNVA